MEADGYYSEHFITQHDLLRQLAIYQPKLDPNNKRRIIDNWGDNLPECLTEQKHQPIKACLLSISSGCPISLLANTCTHAHAFKCTHTQADMCTGTHRGIQIVIFTLNFSLHSHHRAYCLQLECSQQICTTLNCQRLRF